MIRIIDGVAFHGKPGSGYNVTAHPLGNGHIEVTASRVTDWVECDWSESVMRDHLDMLAKYREEHADDYEKRKRDIACKRAKTAVRRLCKRMGVDTLLTLTYRACETDLDRAKADLKEFNRRMLRVLPGFAFVAAFERQKRGAWHMHLATRNIPGTLPGAQGEFRSFNVIRAIWRSVTKDREGNIDVKRRKRNSQKSAAQIASYIASYIAKEFEDGDKGVNRYAKYGKVDDYTPVKLGYVSNLRDALDIAFALLPESCDVQKLFLNRWHDVFYLAAESPNKKGPRGPV